MNIIKPYVKDVVFFEPDSGENIEALIERIGRVCYQSSPGSSGSNSANEFIRMLQKNGHHAMLEFGYAVAFIIADRGFTHELVRHRLASFAQESTRWCNYSKGKFGETITVIEQPGLEKCDDPLSSYKVWEDALRAAEHFYLELIRLGVPAQIARSVLPIGLKAEIVIGCNLREWKHIFTLRTKPNCHPIMKSVINEIEDLFKRYSRVLFG